jgi:O-antigen/teichoic acid export membrane protein
VSSFAAALFSWQLSRAEALRRAAFGKSREGAVIRTAITSFVTRGLSVIASLLTVPLVLQYAGQERYGIWMAAIAVTTLFAAADGGVSNALIGLVAKASGAGNREKVRVLVASAFATACALTIIFTGIALAIISAIDWTRAFNLSNSSLGAEARIVVSTLCIGVGAAFPATVFREARVGLLQGARVNLWDFGGLAAGFAGLLVAIYFDLGLPTIAAIWAGAPALARTAGAAVFLAGPGRDLFPSLSKAQLGASRSLLAGGGIYVLYSVTQMLSIQSGPILIAKYLGAAAVADFSVVQRLFLQPQVIATIALAAQWPAYGDAMGRGDLAWVRQHFRRSLVIYTLASAAICGGLALFSRDILMIWVGTAVTVPKYFIPAMFVLGVITTLSSVFAYFFLALAWHRPLIFAQLTMAVVGLAVSIYAIPLIGSLGAVIAAAAAYLTAYVLPGLFLWNGAALDIRAGKRLPGAQLSGPLWVGQSIDSAPKRRSPI